MDKRDRLYTKPAPLLQFNMTLSTLLQAIRFPLVALVVVIHVLPFESQPVDLSWDINNIYAFVSEFFSHGIGAVANPTFFMISGYLFYYGKKSLTKEQYKGKLLNRLHSLVIPYFLWIGIAIVSDITRLYSISLIGGSPVDWAHQLNPSRLLTQLWHAPADFPLWFLRDLICVSLIAPLLHLLISFTRGLALFVLLTLYVLGLDCGIPGFSTVAISFFSLGIYLGSNSIDLTNISRGGGVKYLVITWLGLIISYIFNNTSSYFSMLLPIANIVGIFAGICFFRSIYERFDSLANKMMALEHTTFFIYACHLVHIEGWFKGFFSRIDFMQSGVWQFVAYFSIPTLTILTCLGLYYGLERMAPRVLSPLVGNRSGKA